MADLPTFHPDTKLVDEVVQSPNYDQRRVDIIVLHSIGSATMDEALRVLTRERPSVSAHYLVGEDGRIVQLVPEAMRAWHAGPSVWAGFRDVNSRSIGIEISRLNKIRRDADFPAAQIEAVIALCRHVIARHAIRPQRILAHSDIAPGRKQDPGEDFPWDKLHAQGIGHWVAPEPLGEEHGLALGDRGADVASLQADLMRYGYEIAVTGSYDEPPRRVVEAFQRHFRPARVDGIADRSTVTTLRNLLASLASL